MITFATVARRGGRYLPVIGSAALVGTLTTLALPMVLGRTVDAIVAGAASGHLLALAVGLTVLGVASEVAGAFAGTACVAGTTAWLRGRFVRHVLAIPPVHSRRFDSGDLVSRVSGDAGEAANAGPAAVTIASSVLPPLGSVALLALMDLALAIAFIASAALVVVVLIIFTRKSADVMTSYQRAQGLLAARLTESLRGARTIAAAGTVGHEERRVLALLPQLRDLGTQTWHVLARAVGQSGVVGPLVLVTVVTVAGIRLADGAISPGQLLAASQYAVLGAGLGGMTSVFAEVSRAKAGVRRLTEVLAVPPFRYGDRAVSSGQGDTAAGLEFRHVTVRSGEDELLRDINLTIPAATTVAVVGQSGAGKSILAELAARLRDPDDGVVLLDGVPLSEYSHSDVRRAVGVAFERPVLVGTSVADAIGMGSTGTNGTPAEDTEREHVTLAARASHAHDFIVKLPAGYDTLLDDAPMSGGERQRIGLARAARASRMLVLDDATSSLDMVTEMQIGHTLTNGSLGKTTRLIVTHRAATAARAHLVVWLESGRVRAIGTHSSLSNQPSYQRVFE